MAMLTEEGAGAVPMAVSASAAMLWRVFIMGGEDKEMVHMTRGRWLSLRSWEGSDEPTTVSSSLATFSRPCPPPQPPLPLASSPEAGSHRMSRPQPLPLLLVLPDLSGHGVAPPCLVGHGRQGRPPG
uniref:Uncharacterized protein n=1 Tax=Oryza sativa subsp. japonica TaxID=39947 RepID=Q8W5G7_ORYSJ|nr:hypothetical protein [Oryza sativa Japonica Group]